MNESINKATPTFSICHATARVPDGWINSWKTWSDNCSTITNDPRYGRSQVEYILSVHKDHEAQLMEQLNKRLPPGGIALKIAVYNTRRCSVDNWNYAAACSTGKILVLAADDFFPPYLWDKGLIEGLDSAGKSVDDEFMIHVGTGNPDQAWEDRLIPLIIMSRPVYERWGGTILYPAYESVVSDDDATEHAYQDGIVIEMRYLTFEHRHPAFGKAQYDDVYRHQNRQEALELGHIVLEQRRRRRFAS